MAERIVSPGVFTREQDLSYLTPAPAEVSTAVVGPAVKGPIDIPTIVRSYSEYVSIFGDRFLSGSDYYQHLSSVSAEKYFEQGGTSLLMTRVVEPSDTWAAAESAVVAGETVGGSISTIEADLTAPFLLSDFGTATDHEFKFTHSGETYRFIFSDPASGIPADQSPIFFVETGSTTPNAIANLSSSFNSNLGLSLELIYGGTGTSVDINSTVAGTTYEGLEVKVAEGVEERIVGTLAGGTNVSAPSTFFTLETLGKGEIFNSSGSVQDDGSVDAGTVDNFRVELRDVDSDLGVFDIYIRRGDDTDKTPIFLETYSNVNLDPNSENYIAAVIGDTHYALNAEGDAVQEYGEYPNRSRLVRVQSVNVQQPDYFDNSGKPKAAFAADLDVLAGAEGVIPFISGQGSIAPAGAKFLHEINGDDTEGIEALAGDVPGYSNAVKVLNNTEGYRFDVLVTPGLNQQQHATTVGKYLDLVQERGDSIYILDTVPYGAAVGDAVVEAKELNSSYAATYWPWVKVQTQGIGKQIWSPASVVMPGVYAFSDSVAASWFAPAGMVRGGIPGVLRAERKLSKTDRDSLYSAKVNPLATFPGTGVVAYGQKTLQTKPSALDRVNVRRLLITLKRFIGNQANNLVFEQNSIATRNRFLAAVNPYLDIVVQREGLYAFRVVMDDINNPADVVDRNMLVGQIYIQPTKTAEFIVLDFVVEPTGARFEV